MRGAMVLVLVVVSGCMTAPPVECVVEEDEIVATPTCEGDAGDGYEWRVLCDHHGDDSTRHLNRYAACGADPHTGEVYDLEDEAAYCAEGPRCLPGGVPRCYAVPCDGRAHRPEDL